MGHEMTGTDPERDLLVQVDNSINMSTQCAAAMIKADFLIRIIKSGTKNRRANIKSL